MDVGFSRDPSMLLEDKSVDHQITVFLMRNYAKAERTAESGSGRVNLHQGRSTKAPHNSIYDPKRTTLQLYNLRSRSSKEDMWGPYSPAIT